MELLTSPYFVDKTLMIRDICRFNNITFLYTRPRHFGKTTNLSMLDHFFNIRYKDEPDAFEGLKIGSFPECWTHRNAYPVIRMDMSELRGGSEKEYYESLGAMISDIADQFLGSVEEKLLSEHGMRFLRTCSDTKLAHVDADKSIKRICSILERAYGRKVIVLMDEYDRCVRDIDSVEETRSRIGLLRPFLEQTFKFNESLKTGVITGVFPIPTATMHGGFDSACMCTILDKDGEEYFGFTDSEVEELLRKTGNPSETMAEMRKWHGGYHVGDAELYNPYGVVMYLKNGCRPGLHLNENVIGSLPNSEEFLSVLNGTYDNGNPEIRSAIHCTVTRSDIALPSAGTSAVCSYLTTAGYLRAVPTGELENGNPVCRVKIANEEASLALRGRTRIHVVPQLIRGPSFNLYKRIESDRPCGSRPC